jgi:peptidoglycan/xylan/chitin deacetylase (PgdA/CDA1 family)
VSSPARRVGKRARLAGALDRVGLLDRLLWLRARLGLGGLAVLTFHRIGSASVSPGFDTDVIDAEPEELEAMLDVIGRQCTVISMSDLHLFAAGRRLPPNPVMITFDDGYADNHRVVLPILRRAALPATFFIATKYPESGQLFWWDRISLTVSRCTRQRVALGYPAPLILSPKKDSRRASNELLSAVKRARGLDLARLWEELERATGVVIHPEEERALAAREIMSWADIREIHAAGMDVESHSHAHFVLNGLGPSGAARDLKMSAETLGEQLGRPVRAVSYPVGYELRGAMRAAPLAARMELGFTNHSGLCDLRRFDPLNVPRLSVAPGLMAAAYKLSLLIGDGRSASVWRGPIAAARAGP